MSMSSFSAVAPSPMSKSGPSIGSPYASPQGSKRMSMSSRGGYRDASALLNESTISVNADEAVKVLCRVRPFNAREEQLHVQMLEGKPAWEQMPLRSIVEFKGNTCLLYDLMDDGFRERERFTFDGCLWSIPSSVQDSDNDFVSQETMFDLYGRDMLAEVWKGFNTCFFAYGQTGSGKTYSMMGEEDNPGFIPRLGQCLFDQIDEVLLETEQESAENFVRQFRVEVRYMEIYNEMAKDLLWPLSPLAPEMKAKLNPENLRIRSTPATGVFVEGLTGIEVDSWKRMQELIELGNVSRSVASTKMNERSSRSHAVFKITLSQITTSVPKKQFEKPTQHLRSAQINLVDLAGSERNKKTGATGDRLKEAASINRSLMCLKQVIDALVDNSQITKAANKKRIPYRDSHLTSILMDSLGGNAKTWMLVCVSPHSDNSEETQQTLRYGSRARKILNTVHVNENASARLMLDLEDELDRLKAELANSNETDAPDVVESIKAQIEAHESAIGNLEGKVESQRQKIEELQMEQEKSSKLQSAAAVAGLSHVMQARLLRDAVQNELLQKRDESAALEEQLRRTQSESSMLELETQRSTEEAKRLRQSAGTIDDQIDDFKRKGAKLESQRRALQKSCEEGEQLVKNLAQERFATILRARLQVARLNIDFRRRLEDFKASLSRKKIGIQEGFLSRERALDEDIQDELTARHQQIASLKAQIATVTTDRDKLSADKANQITILQQEVAHLQQELRKKKEAHQVKLQQLSLDWDRKLSGMIADMERQHRSAEDEWAEKRRQLRARTEERKAAMVAAFQVKVQQLQQASDAELKDAIESGQVACQKLEEDWSHVIHEKRQRNDQLREKLREIVRNNAKYCELHYRISTSMDVLKKIQQRGATFGGCSSSPKTFSSASISYGTLSEEARRIVACALEFHALFEEFHPEKVKLDHLIKANLTLQRCATVPILGEGDEGSSIRAKSPSARSQSPIVLRPSSMSSRRDSATPSQQRRSIDSMRTNNTPSASQPRVLKSVSPRLSFSASPLLSSTH